MVEGTLVVMKVAKLVDDGKQKEQIKVSGVLVFSEEEGCNKNEG